MQPYVAVVGASDADDELAARAEQVGRLLAERGAVLLTGGLGGVMEASCRGAKDAGGLTVAILPNDDRSAANAYVDVALATGMGEMRNALIVRSADVLIAVGGGYGTLSEVGFALRIGTPVVGLGTWELAKQGAPVAAFPTVTSPEDAVDVALRACLGS